MRIVIKQMDEDGVNDITYLMTEDYKPIRAIISSGMDSIYELNDLINEHLKPYCEINGFKYKDRVETVKFKKED